MKISKNFYKDAFDQLESKTLELKHQNKNRVFALEQKIKELQQDIINSVA